MALYYFPWETAVPTNKSYWQKVFPNIHPNFFLS